MIMSAATTLINALGRRIARVYLAAQPLQLTAQAAVFQRAAYAQNYLVGAKWFGYIVKRPRLHRLHCILDTAEGGDQQNGQIGIKTPHLRDHFRSLHARHH